MRRLIIVALLASNLLQLESAQAANYVENFTNGVLSTGITVKQNGSDIGISSPSNSDGIEAQYNNKYLGIYGLTGYYLNLHMVTTDVTITFPSNSRPTGFSFIASIVNGTQYGSFTYTDGTTSSFSIPNTVGSYVNYFTTVTVTGDGRQISSFKINGGVSNDYWALDDLSWSSSTLNQSTATLTSADTSLFRSSISITATVNTPGRITFFADGKKISGCISRLITTSINCNWKPNIHKAFLISARLIPTDSSYLPSASEPISIKISPRTNPR